jgi:hypothetical protein
MAGSLPLRARYWRRRWRCEDARVGRPREARPPRQGLTVAQHAEEFAPSRHTRASSEAGLAAGRGSVLRFANLGTVSLARRSIGCVRTDELPQQRPAECDCALQPGPALLARILRRQSGHVPTASRTGESDRGRDARFLRAWQGRNLTAPKCSSCAGSRARGTNAVARRVGESASGCGAA